MGLRWSCLVDRPHPCIWSSGRHPKERELRTMLKKVVIKYKKYDIVPLRRKNLHRRHLMRSMRWQELRPEHTHTIKQKQLNKKYVLYYYTGRYQFCDFKLDKRKKYCRHDYIIIVQCNVIKVIKNLSQSICAASHKPFLYRRRPPQQTGDMRKSDIVQG